MKKNLFIVIAMAVSTLVSCNKPQPASDEQVINNIMTRVSVRQFTGERLSDEQVQTLLRCAMAAPSAVNRQPWAFIVVGRTCYWQPTLWVWEPCGAPFSRTPNAYARHDRY